MSRFEFNDLTFDSSLDEHLLYDRFIVSTFYFTNRAFSDTTPTINGFYEGFTDLDCFTLIEF